MVKQLDDRLLLNVDIALKISFYENRTRYVINTIYILYFDPRIFQNYDL